MPLGMSLQRLGGGTNAVPQLSTGAMRRGPCALLQWQGRGRRGRLQLCCASLKDDLEEVLAKVRVRQAAMQAAAEAEDYGTAAAERDALNMLQLRRRQLDLELDAETRIVRYEIGSVMRHRRYNYRGVIVGFDDHCCAPETWIQHMRVDKLSQGRKQPFYHVLVDEAERPASARSYSTTYVAQENIEVLSAEAAAPVQNELIESNFDDFVDGKYVPKSHLRKQYPAGGSGGSDAEDESGAGEPGSDT